MQITKVSPLTGYEHTAEIDITPEQYAAFQNGELPNIQEAFPHLSADEREFLMSGITPYEWELYVRGNDA